MKIAIIDDLVYDRLKLQDMLSSYFTQKKITCELAVFKSGESFLNVFHPGCFTAIFLDNLMGGINGMETARRIRLQDTDIPIIFVTTEESYALEGYTVQAFDYLIKPVSRKRIHCVLDRLCRQSLQERFIEIKEKRIPRRIWLKHILYIRSSGHFLEIHMKNEICRCYMTLDALIIQLEEAGEYGSPDLGLPFQNCCRGHLVNLEEVRCIENHDFLLSNGVRIPISRSNTKNMQAAYAAFLFSRTRNMP